MVSVADEARTSRCRGFNGARRVACRVNPAPSNLPYRPPMPTRKLATGEAQVIAPESSLFTTRGLAGGASLS